MARAATTHDVFNAIGDVARRQILSAIGAGESDVNSLCVQLQLPQPAVSKHLHVLRSVDLVRVRADSRRRVYRINAEALRPVHAWVSEFERIWQARLDRLDQLLADLQAKSAEPDPPVEPGHWTDPVDPGS
jgi:DNA-binding transcriptional ArsR family regulator